MSLMIITKVDKGLPDALLLLVDVDDVLVSRVGLRERVKLVHLLDVPDHLDKIMKRKRRMYLIMMSMIRMIMRMLMIMKMVIMLMLASREQSTQLGSRSRRRKTLKKKTTYHCVILFS